MQPLKIDTTLSSVSTMSYMSKFMIASPNEKKSSIELYSPKYFLACGLGGIIACGPTHSLVTPLDLVKCRSQVKPGIYKGVFDGWKTIYRSEGLRGIFTGVGPTAIGYSFQGAGKYGLYEYFKYQYGVLVGEENSHKYRGILYLGASASAEFFADIFLCPWEALKVRMQTSLPPYAKTTKEGFNKLMAQEGLKGFYKGIGPLWARQIPYTMAKFASFEATVEAIYKVVLKKPKSEYNSMQQLGVSFAGGYIAGILCAVVSHPADVLVSKLNNMPKPASGEKPMGVGALIKELGMKGLWRGLGARIFMIGTLTGLQWLLYDTFKVNVGLPTTGGADDSEKK
ncbi:mitochondrial carrier domain-containing protein [Radiomyces spectabilis]|uniref:mitochondrial carrier domain-containing protein n=1 Tax=Radiomyces spectabilis TaxID=64574 RepID=UPI0022204662|nr:mitochondrial carrier domain-containing protein [Radiomyces spectabilis]KAI8391774.1 mitochondrial carrier domain-containing protein [Radiomyces spectabilis]